MNKITFKNREGLDRTLEQVSTNMYKLSGNSAVLRLGGNPDDIQFIDFQGGPFIGINSDLSVYGVKAIVTKIEHDDTANESTCMLTVNLKKS